MEKRILQRIRQLEQFQKVIEEKLQGAQMRKVRCKSIRGHYRYYVDGKYVSKRELPSVKQWVEMEYFVKILPEIKRQITKLKGAQKNIEETELEKIYDTMHPGKRQFITTGMISKEEKIRRFEEEIYEGKKIEDLRSEYYTNKGERVRSKSEKIIADHFERRGILYKYEKPIYLMAGGRVKVFYPDFTVMNRRTTKILYVEHLGMWDEQEYYNASLRKLDVYEKNDLLIGRDLLLFHETASRTLDMKNVDKYIDEYMI